MDKQDVEKNYVKIRDVILQQLANKIKTKREENNVSIRKLNQISGVCTAVISDLENGKYIPKTDAIIRIALALDIPIQEILSSMLPADTTLNTEKDEFDSFVPILTSLGFVQKEIQEIESFITFKALEKIDKIKPDVNTIKSLGTIKRDFLKKMNYFVSQK